MVALATSVGLVDGPNSTTFAIALALAAIVTYDAASGVRRAAGKNGWHFKPYY
ncbi:MAG: divergent PAP2 family protein [Vampirovibrionales bacterium]